jgi:ectoine hydroxylase-related dioxygenase (phytanoyl-CoA dioxygenase family)
VRHTHTDLVIHHDDAPTKVPRPRAPFSAAIMAVFDDYTEMNGATKVIPGSHCKGTFNLVGKLKVGKLKG